MSTGLQLVRQKRSVTKALEANLGGRWLYVAGACGWFCDDEKRNVGRCWNGDDGDDGVVEYWLYGQGNPQRAEKFMR